jgi:hypothetical protein
MQPFPSVIQDFIDAAKKIKEPWVQYLQQFTIAPPAFIDITVGASPFEYQDKEPGNIFISGGTVSGITLTRGVDTITVAPDTSTPRIIPVAVNDIIEVTYTVLPTMKFIPLYGVDTHNF